MNSGLIRSVVSLLAGGGLSSGAALAGEPVSPDQPVVGIGDGSTSVVIGPDVVVSNLPDWSMYGTVGGITGYALGTTSCNIGDAIAEWFDSGANQNQHPVIPQNLYRVMNGRFEQIGMSWLKHGWCAADGGACTAAGGPPTCSSASGCDWLGIGCTDTYGSGLNGDQGDLGPRSEVNASTGVYPYPYIMGWNATGNAIYKRLQVKVSDLDPANTVNAIFLGESQYITTDENPPQRLNNSSWRRVNRSTTFTTGYALSFTGNTVPRQNAIEAWPTFTPGAVVQSQDVPNDGRFFLGHYVQDNGDGTWNYEYALYNMNSHRSARSLSLPAAGVNITNIGFHDVDYHSGELYSGTDWSGAVAAGELSWSTQTFAQNSNANALRWHTLYNFRFTANQPPVATSITVGLFRPGDPASIQFNSVGPRNGVPGDMNCDGIVSTSDIGPFVLALTDPAAYAAAFPGCSINNGDLNGDAQVSVGDIGAFVALVSGG